MIPIEFPSTFSYHIPTANEKFLTYFPHSGFHNQRIELENALLLAYYLNRTLILPPVYLRNPAFPWSIFDKMYSRLLLQTKHGLEYCHSIRPGEPLPTECLSYHRWTTVPWTFFYTELKDLTAKTNGQLRIIFRDDDDLSFEWIRVTLNLQNEDDIYFYKDYSPFDYRVYDLPESTTPLKRYTHRVELDSLMNINQTVLHFGSLFGTYRVLAQKEDHQQVFQWIRQAMIFTNSHLVDTADQIVAQLGGPGAYVGIHLRVGDGLFKTRGSIHVDDIYHQLVNEYTDLTRTELEKRYDKHHNEDRKENEGYETRQIPMHNEKLQQQQVQEVEPTKESIIVQHPTTIAQRLGPKPSTLRMKCQPTDGRNDAFSQTVIFIATDCPHPREHPLLRKIFETFPCTFVLDDFVDDLDKLGQIYMKKDNIKLEPWLIPMVDAVIASKGHTFYGTTSSTFSTYIERQLHPAYTNQPIK
ncbi:hypothetical protein BDF20DRAFT_826466 [Mycotypha africana]|uniref:uncharacterized protein n=1 Tax=Mycotypha africana TaxID=64632 RepID=UPI002301524B|nr:uncharacterized protein BDF20DRAFT_826466 [Mycotypha africana]KAI8970147.1 hypothetical protein BDF20DRAFT_826466 [Mycotypha africana]